MNDKNKRLWKKAVLPVAGTIIGALLGYVYYLKIGCVTGTCAVTSDPAVSTIYGAVMGLLVSGLFTGKKQRKDTDEKKCHCE